LAAATPPAGAAKPPAAKASQKAGGASAQVANQQTPPPAAAKRGSAPGGRKPTGSESAGGSAARPVRQRRLPAGLQDSHVIVESPTVKTAKKGGGRGAQKGAADTATQQKKSQMEEEEVGDQVLEILFFFFRFLCFQMDSHLSLVLILICVAPLLCCFLVGAAANVPDPIFFNPTILGHLASKIRDYLRCILIWIPRVTEISVRIWLNVKRMQMNQSVLTRYQ
jgi:hypothetical protein